MNIVEIIKIIALVISGISATILIATLVSMRKSEKELDEMIKRIKEGDQDDLT